MRTRRTAAKVSPSRSAGPSLLASKATARPAAASQRETGRTVARPSWSFGNIALTAPPKSDVAGAHDAHEREADRTAERVTRGSPAVSPATSKVTHAPLKVQKKPGAAQPAVAGSSHSGLPPSAPPIVNEVLRSPGEPLDASSQAFFESRFGQSFRHVRIHKDRKAAESARALRADAYTIGRDIVIADQLYSPDTREGRRLLAHELAHVVQQQSTPQHIHASGHALTATPQRLQCKPQSNWAGTFSDDVYRPMSEPKGKPPAYGAHIEISFQPSDKVDAENIAFVQTAQMVTTPNLGADPVVHTPFYVTTEKDRKVLDSRTLSDDPETLGTHIDQTTAQRTPLYTMTGASDADIKSKKKNDSPLAASTSSRFSDFGHQSAKQAKKNATMTDQPGLSADQPASAFGKFETTALAVEGAQQGAYYGTVTWGFTKESGETEAKLLPFVLSPSSAPSGTFFDAAKLFGGSKTTADEQSLSLPHAADRYLKADTNLLSTPDKGKIAGLTLNTPVETLDETTRNGWVKVAVTGGDHKGATGWLKLTDLSSTPTPKIVPKHH